MIGKRTKAVSLFALTGFLLGIAANLVYFNALPVLVHLFPALLERTWLLWGIVGASVSLIGCLVYIALPEK